MMGTEQASESDVLHVDHTCNIMQRKLTLMLDEAVYEGLYRRVGARNISAFVERLVRPHVVEPDLDAAYAEMAAQPDREADASDWSDALIADANPEAAP